MQRIDENPNKAVLTTRYVIKNNSPVVCVIYDEDGDWQFLGASDNLWGLPDTFRQNKNR